MEEQKKERLFYLDFIRALSVIIITVYHFNLFVMRQDIEENVSLPLKFSNGDWGQVGVILFFIISGASLAYVYTEKYNLKKYFIKRWKHIYPMFYIMYGLGFLYLFWKNRGISFKDAAPWSFLLTILGFDGYTNSLISNYYILGTWFLGCIILLYLCFPVLNYVINRWPKISFILLLLFYIFIVQTYNMSLKKECNFIVRIFDFSLGIYFILLFEKNKIKINKLIILFATIIAAVVLFINLPIDRPYKITIIGVSFFLILVFISQYIKKGKTIITWLSKISYPVFLCHIFVEKEILNHFKGKDLSYVEIGIILIIILLIIFALSILANKINNIILRSSKNIKKI